MKIHPKINHVIFPKMGLGKQDVTEHSNIN